MNSVKLIVHLVVAIILIVLFSIRLNQPGNWHPGVLQKFSSWEVTELPLTQEDLFFMGEPNAVGMYFKNSFDEIVFCRMIAVDSPEAFNPPKILFTDYEIVGAKIVTIGGNKRAYAQLFKLKGAEDRVVMISWLQDRSGKIHLDGIDYESQKEFASRVRLGYAALVGKLQNSNVFRVYTIIPAVDRSGKQPLRNVFEVAEQVVIQVAAVR